MYYIEKSKKNQNHDFLFTNYYKFIIIKGNYIERSDNYEALYLHNRICFSNSSSFLILQIN